VRERNGIIQGFDMETNGYGFLEDLDVGGLYYSVIQKNVSSRTWSGLIWLRIETVGGQL
jgi:hypothetical protein